MKENRKLLFPALRCVMGDSIYYATFMTFRDIDDWIKPTDEVHPNRELSAWIQRQLMGKHANKIANYLTSQKERFFSAIVVGIYGGEPSWSPLSVHGGPGGEELTQKDTDDLESSVGLLKFSGTESVFAIDGQHRVAGIKKAVQESSELLEDEIVALFVGHEKSPEGIVRTRRLFTTLNKTAQKIKPADRIALDEDDGFAIVTRRLVNEFSPLNKPRLVHFSGTAALPKTNRESLTTIVTLYNIVSDLFIRKVTINGVSKNVFKTSRPADEDLDAVFVYLTKYWKLLIENIPLFARVLGGEGQFGDFRTVENNHLLCRPAGQRAFAKSTQVMMTREIPMEKVVRTLSQQELWINNPRWNNILWDPISKVMLKNATLASSYLLSLAAEPASTEKNGAQLEKILSERGVPG